MAPDDNISNTGKKNEVLANMKEGAVGFWRKMAATAMRSRSSNDFRRRGITELCKHSHHTGISWSFGFFGGDAIDRHHEDPHSSAAIAKEDFLVHKLTGFSKQL